MAETRNERVPFGISGAVGEAALATVEREIPADEPPPLPPNAELKVIGKPIRRLDTHLKATGAARYTADVRLPGMLYGRLLDSPHAHARIRSIDVSAAEAHPEVRAVHVIDTITGVATERDPGHQRLSVQRVSTGAAPEQNSKPRYPEVRYAGQPIAAVAATTPEAAKEALKLIRVDYEVLPFVANLDDAMRDGAPLVFEGPIEQEGSGGGGGAEKGLPQRGNVRGPSTRNPFRPEGGDIDRALAEAEVTVEGEYRTQVQTHQPLEPHGIVVDLRRDGMTVYASTQDTVSVREELAEVFGMPRSKIRVVCEFMGGGFGAKFGAGNYGVAAAHLSQKARAPVWLMLTRKEQHTQVGNRPGTLQRLTIGARRDGTLTAIKLVSYGTAGAGLGAGVGQFAGAVYRSDAYAQEQYDVLMHANPGTAFRAPGNAQGAFAFEQAIDELAEKLGMDALALRDKLDSSPQRREQRRIGAEMIGWAGRKAPGADPGPVKRGIGVAQAFWPRIVETDSAAEVRVLKDGSVEVLSSVQDLGTGVRTVLAQVAAEELGIEAHQVTVRIGDTSFPAGPGSGGSKTTGSITPAVRHAAHRVREKLFVQVAPELQTSPDDLVARDGRVLVRDNPSRSLSFEEACGKMRREQIAEIGFRRADYGGFRRDTPNGGMSHGDLGGVQFAQVAVDTETGYVKVERVVAVHDCGRPINPLQLESQINGGILQGISWALYENRILDQATGRQVNPNLDQYKILGSRETPRIEIKLLEDYQGRSNTDAFGIGEPALIPTAPAVANAVHNATGVRMRSLPMNTQAVLTALGKVG